MNKNKIILVGKLVAQKLGFKFVDFKVNDYNIDLNFINKEGFKRCYSTRGYLISEYLNFTSCDIMKTLFNI